LHDLTTDRALSRDHPLVVKRVNVRIAVLLSELSRICDRLIKSFSVKDHVRAVRTCRHHLRQRSKLGKNYRRLDMMKLGRESDRLSMITRRAGHDAAVFLVVRKTRYRVV